MVTEAQKRASDKWQREKSEVVSIKFGPNDTDRLAHMKRQSKEYGDRSKYIKHLIDKDMAENSEKS